VYSLFGLQRFCRELILENGAPFRLEPFQRVLLEAHFGGATELVCVIPKKNGKTTLLAALALYHLKHWPAAEVVIGASSRDQARILFKQAAGLVTRGRLGGDFDVKSGYGEIRLRGGTKDGPRIRVLAADAATGDGVIPTLALVDELHRHPSADLYGVFRDGLGPRGGRMITISTAGASLDSPLGKLRAAALKLEHLDRDEPGKHTFARSGDGEFVMHEWSLDPEDNVDDLKLVLKANPASWQTIAALRRRHDSPSMTPWQWRRFGCGIWTEGEEPWIDPGMWDRLRGDVVIGPDDPVWVGVDVGVRHDSSAVVTVAGTDGEVACKARILRPGEGGVPLELVEQAVRDACEGMNVREVVYDPWTFRRSAELLEREGLPMIEFPQSAERMANASANLYRLIETGQLVHDGNAELRAHVMAGAVKQTERGWRLVKNPSSPRAIDALIALAMAALPAASSLAPAEPVFAWG
jgi:phage terminase large subunit-like protein